MPRTFAIGDIHGAQKALEQLLGRLDLQREDRLIFLGDYVDGWSQSAGVIGYLMELSKSRDCIFIKGNHDAWCESWLSGDIADAEWLLHGGLETVKSYAVVSVEERKRHLLFFNGLRNYYIDAAARRLLVHAGFTSMHGPEAEYYESSFYWDRTLWEVALAVDQKIGRQSKLYPQRLLLFDEFIIGHTPTLNYDMEIPMHACNVWNIDTGAGFKGRLTAMDIDTKQYWQSDPVQQLYPKEKGRNR